MRIEPSPSWKLFFGCLGIGFGIAAASWLSGGLMIVAVIVLTLIVLVYVRLLSAHDRIKILGIFILGLSIGIGRYAVVGPGGDSVANDVGSFAIVEGRIVGADLNDNGVTYVVDSLMVDDVRRDDRIRLEAPISSTAQIGDYVRTSCVLEQPRPFDGFAYDRFLAAKSIYAICRLSSAPFVLNHESISASDRFWLVVGSIHTWIDDRTRSILPEPQATLLLGLLIGENSFSDVWKTKFQITGTSHIVAASGYNVAVVAELALIFLVTLGLYRRQAYPIIVICIFGFVILAGAGGAVIRAGVMGVLALTARHIGRRASPRNILTVTIVLMLLFEPRLLRDDVGFQLSVMATVGLVLLSDRFSGVLKRIPSAFGLRESFASTLAATVATLPVIMFSFGKVSLVAPFVNMFVLPFTPYAMAFGGISIVASSIVHASGVWIALPAWTFLATMTSVIEVGSKIPFAAIDVGVGISFVCLLLGLGVLRALLRRLPKTFERDLDAISLKKMFIVLSVAIGLFCFHIGYIAWQSGRLNSADAHVFVFDVGQGDAIFIDGKEKDIVIDGGPTRYSLLEALSMVRFPWERHIDLLVSSHPHSDHITGLLGILNQYDVNEVIENGSVYLSPSEEAFTLSAPNSIIAMRGESWNLGENATFDVLWPLNETADVTAENVHERSVVARLTVGEKTMLFPGDAEQDIEAALGDIGHIDVLKVGHHGSDTSSSSRLLEDISPSFAVISVGEGNSYGHPSVFVLSRFRQSSLEVLRTDERGTIRFDFWKDYIVVAGN